MKERCNECLTRTVKVSNYRLCVYQTMFETTMDKVILAKRCAAFRDDPTSVNMQLTVRTSDYVRGKFHMQRHELCTKNWTNLVASRPILSPFSVNAFTT